jgi:hypothetical protein
MSPPTNNWRKRRTEQQVTTLFLSKCLLLKEESLNCDGQQFHQYQKNESPAPQIIEHKRNHNIWRWTIQFLASDRYISVAGVNNKTSITCFIRQLVSVFKKVKSVIYMLFSYPTEYIMWYSRLRIYIRSRREYISYDGNVTWFTLAE